ncbi:MAG: hypothetical protein Q8M03_16640 [Legionella sp.]|nr:hypothetical protein [Legionella sp.]
MSQSLLKSYSLFFIHALILTNPSIEEVVAELNVDSSALQEHLAQFVCNGGPITIELLKSSTPSELRKAFGHTYSYPLTKTLFISNYSLKQIHSLILTWPVKTIVAEGLGINRSTLDNQLSSFKDKEEILLTFKKLQTLTIQAAQEHWGDDYTTLRETSLLALTFKTIHSHIRNSDSLDHAADKLKVRTGVLSRFLARSKLNLNYEVLKNSTEESVRSQYGNAYSQPIEVFEADFSTVTLAQIHAQALTGKSIVQIANEFDVHANTIRFHLNNFTLSDKHLTFRTLTKLKVQKAEAHWETTYYKPLLEINTKPSSRKRKFSEVDLGTSNDEDQQSAPPLPTLTEEPYSKDTMTSPEECGDKDTNPLKIGKICLKTSTFETIHAFIRESKSMYQATKILQVSMGALARFFTRSVLKLNYDLLKNSTERSLVDQFGQAYYLPVEVSQVDISTRTLAEIHECILFYKKITPVTDELGVHSTTLRKQLACIAYNNIPLTFEDLTSLTAEEAYDIWKEKYGMPLQDIYTWKPVNKRGGSSNNLQKKAPPLLTSVFNNQAPLKAALTSSSCSSLSGGDFFEDRNRDKVAINLAKQRFFQTASQSLALDLMPADVQSPTDLDNLEAYLQGINYL